MPLKSLLPWQDLFLGEYLPNVDPGSRNIPSQDDIHLFLEEGILKAGSLKHGLNLVETACKQWANRKHSQVTATLEKFHHNSNYWAEVNDILTKMSEWQLISKSTQKEDRVPLSRAILSTMKGLKANLHWEQKNRDCFFSNLENTPFTGTVHCEACLASLLPSFTQQFLSDSNEYKDMNILSELQVEYSRFICFCHLILIFFSPIYRVMGRLLEC